MSRGRSKSRNGPKKQASAAAVGSELRLTVWQFVRLMVQAEKSRESGQNAGVDRLFETYGPAWQDLDARLESLGRDDPVAFAELMMEQEVILEDVTLELQVTLGAEIRKVVRAMKQTLNRGAPEAASTEDLQFEIAELEAVGQRLKAR